MVSKHFRTVEKLYLAFSKLRAAGSDRMSEASAGRYMPHGLAAIWIQCCAARLVVYSIRMQLLSPQAQCTPQGPFADAQLETCRDNICLQATDMCCSVPFFFNVCNTTQDELESESLTMGDGVPLSDGVIGPKMALVLAWPLAMALSIEAVPKAQQLWLQHRLKTIASVIGADVLRSIAEEGEFKL